MTSPLRYLRSPAAIVVGETALLGLLQFATFALLLRMVDKPLLGLWILVNSLLGFARVTDFWSKGLSSFVGEAIGAGDRRRAQAFVETAVLTGGVGYVLAALVGTGILYGLADWLSDGADPQLVRAILPYMAITFWLSSVAGSFQLGFLGFLRPGLKVVQSVGAALLLLVLIAILVPRHGLWGIVAAQLGQALFSLVFGVLAYRFVIVGSTGLVGWQRDCLRHSVSFGGKMLLVGVLQLAIEPVIRVLANQFGGLSTVTLVELAARFIALARGLLTSVGQVLIPSFAMLRGGGDSARRGQMMRRAQAEFILIGTLGFSLLVAAGPFIATIMLGHQDQIFMMALALLAVGWLANLFAAPSFFLCVGERRFLPLLVHHLIMTGGALCLGGLGGAFFGLVGALVGIAFALVLSGLQLVLRMGYPADRDDTLVVLLPRLMLVPLSAALGLWLLWDLAPGNDTVLRSAMLAFPFVATLATGVAVLPLREMLGFLAVHD